MRIGVDCIGANARAVHSQFPDVGVIFVYDTGSPDIKWQPDEVALWPSATKIHIDQGAGSPPVTTATVRDVESGAWTVDAALRTGNWVAERPTQYGSRSTIQELASKGWTGDVWVAWPGWKGNSPPIIKGVNVVAVQNVWAGNYDSSIIFDQYWPYDGPTEEPVFVQQVLPGVDNYSPFPSGTFRQVILLRDFSTDANAVAVRLAVRSAANGWSVHTVNLNSNAPATVQFPEADTDAISVRFIGGVEPVGICLA